MQCDRCGESATIDSEVVADWFNRNIVKRQRTCCNGHTGVTYEVPLEILASVLDKDSVILEVNKLIAMMDETARSFKMLMEPGRVRTCGGYAFIKGSEAMP